MSAPIPKKKSLTRYTDLAFLVEYLVTNKLKLLSPTKWADKNDTHYMEQYDLRIKKNTLALCFTLASDKHHFWTERNDRIAIEFDTKKLLAAAKLEGIEWGKIQYLNAKPLERRPQYKRYPYLKRIAFADEQELRLIKSLNEKKDTFEFDVPHDAISKIRLSPYLNKDTSESIKQMIWRLADKDLTIYRSTLLNNPTFKNLILRKK
jgi:hypothetical protein